MITEHEYPILEFDDRKTATLNPSDFSQQPFDTNKLVITFFPEIMEKLINGGKIIPDRVISGENPVPIYRFADSDVLITLGFVGCPACGGNLDLFNSMGITKVMFCGGGGVLDTNIKVGEILVVDGAIRDEGFSFHYIEPSRYIYTKPDVTEKIINYLENSSVPYIRGLTWTTDAIFRETPDRITRRRKEGAKIVEMEQAGCIAVAQFRDFDYGALIYGGDDVSQAEWDNRDWQCSEGIRYNLVMLCRKLVDII